MTVALAENTFPKTWPEFGTSLFRLFIERMLSPEGVRENLTLSVELEEIDVWLATGDSLILLLPTTCRKKSDICKAISWICAATRPNLNRLARPENKSLQLSKAPKGIWIGEESSELAVISFTLEPLEDFRVDPTSLNARCWASLFNTAIVVEYPINRSWGRGLEMSFDMMIHLAAVENFFFWMMESSFSAISLR